MGATFFVLSSATMCTCVTPAHGVPSGRVCDCTSWDTHVDGVDASVVPDTKTVSTPVLPGRVITTRCTLVTGSVSGGKKLNSGGGSKNELAVELARVDVRGALLVAGGVDFFGVLDFGVVLIGRVVGAVDETGGVVVEGTVSVPVARAIGAPGDADAAASQPQRPTAMAAAATASASHPPNRRTNTVISLRKPASTSIRRCHRRFLLSDYPPYVPKRAMSICRRPIRRHGMKAFGEEPKSCSS
jgi:hypothetical protein